MSPYTQPAQARRTGIAASYLTEPAFARSTGPGTASCFHCEDPTGSSRHNGSNQARRCVIPNRVPQSHTPPACPRQGAWTRCFGRPQDNRQTPIQFAPVQALFQALYTAIKKPPDVLQPITLGFLQPQNVTASAVSRTESKKTCIGYHALTWIALANAQLQTISDSASPASPHHTRKNKGRRRRTFLPKSPEPTP